MIYACGQQNRRQLILGQQKLNGIDYLEVPGDPGCGTTLAVTFLNDATALSLAASMISITGGTPVQVTCIAPATAQDPKVVTVTLDRTGDFSTYTFALVAGPGTTDPPVRIDPRLASVDFSFKAGCPSPADCQPASGGLPVPGPAPDINYLAKDYNGFLQVMLDRLAVLMPGWTETHAADLGVALAEVLAYAADHLSYQQDAVSTEAYLGTARSRISLRRHARLLDYPVGEGSNARALVSVGVNEALTLPLGTRFYPRVPGLGPAVAPGTEAASQLAATAQPVFTIMQPADLDPSLNQMDFYTWQDGDCCLPAGATQATLTGPLGLLRQGRMLVFAEVKGPLTGAAGDADPARRHAVKLLSATVTQDPLTSQDITQITWAAADALPFALCISSTTDAEHGSRPLTGVSVACGNIALADHGTGAERDDLGPVPAAPARYYPRLAQSPLTFRVPYPATDPAAASAAAFLAPGPAGALPDITLTGSDGSTWSPQPDLLSFGATSPCFVPEIEADGSVFLRFGDGQYGQAPAPGLEFTAVYRVGNGTAGNVGRDALAHLVLPPGAPALASPPGSVASVSNPLAAAGGTDPEDMTHIRQFAPYDYQQQRRCVTEADYGAMAAQVSGVSAARGTLRWTGSWYTAFASVEPAAALTTDLVQATTAELDMLRMMGTDIAVEQAVIVGLQIELEICVDPAHFQGDVFQALMAVFVAGSQRTGAPGLLNPASFTFGQTVYASPLVAAAQAVEGVRSATLTVFTRMDAPWIDGVAQGYLTMGRLDIPRCDNDPGHLDHGTFTLHMDGGK